MERRKRWNLFTIREFLALNFRPSPEKQAYERSKTDYQVHFLRSLSLTLAIVMVVYYLSILVNKEFDVMILCGVPVAFFANLLCYRYIKKEPFRSQASKIIVIYVIVFSLTTIEFSSKNMLANTHKEAFMAGLISSYIIGFLFISRVDWRYVTLAILIQGIGISFRINLADNEIQGKSYQIPIIMLALWVFFSKLLLGLDSILFTNYKQSEEGRRRLLEFQKLVEKDFPNEIIILGTDAFVSERILFANEAMLHLFPNKEADEILRLLDSIEIHNSWNYSPESLVYNSIRPFVEEKKALTIDETAFITHFCNIKNCELLKEGEIRKFEIKFGKINWETSRQATFIMLNDVSKQEQITSLRDLHEHKDKMVATVSHDLRTPLNGIIGMIEVARDLIKESKPKKHLQLAIDSANSLILMINDLLDISQISKGKLKMNLDVWGVSQLVDPIIDLIRFPMKKKGLQLFFTNELPGNLYVIADKNRFQQILMNLLGNAVKFTSEGFVKLTISEQLLPDKLKEGTLASGNEMLLSKANIKENTIAKSKQSFHRSCKSLLEGETLNKAIQSKENSSHCIHLFDPNEWSVPSVVFKVEDSGIGIRKENLERSFQEYGKYQNSGNTVGVWLGLAISQNLAKRMTTKIDGGIKVKSEYGKGSEFWFPLEISLKSISKSTSNSSLCFQENAVTQKVSEFMRGVRPQPGSMHELIPPKNASCQSVLIVDDDQINALVIKNYIKEIGPINCEMAHNGYDALLKINRKKFSNSFFGLIFMDHNMPIMDGLECTRRINEKVSKGEIPPVSIIAMTGDIGNDDVESCLQTGMKDVLGKPVSKTRFREVFQKYI